MLEYEHLFDNSDIVIQYHMFPSNFQVMFFFLLFFFFLLWKEGLSSESMVVNEGKFYACENNDHVWKSDRSSSCGLEKL
jgi:hypothetical protein